jgi:hypothetical protein
MNDYLAKPVRLEGFEGLGGGGGVALYWGKVNIRWWIYLYTEGIEG